MMRLFEQEQNRNLWTPTKEEPYHTFSRYMKDRFGRRLYKVALDAGMSCPNRDGTIGYGGCIFCDAGGSGDFAISYHGQDFTKEDFIYLHQDRDRGGTKEDKATGHSAGSDYIAYFQAYTNTYAPVDRLAYLFRSALQHPLFQGISIATRPDAMGPEVMDLLSQLQEEFPHKFLWIELGLQTIHEQTSDYIRRGYPLSVYEACAKELSRRKIPFITHLILGLPGETEDMMLESVRYMNDVKTWGVKLQLLHVLKGTELAREYEKGLFQTLSLEEYVRIVGQSIGLLSPEIIVHRLTGDGSRELLIEPLWSCDKRRVLNSIRHYLKEEGIMQGSLL